MRRVIPQLAVLTAVLALAACQRAEVPSEASVPDARICYIAMTEAIAAPVSRVTIDYSCRDLGPVPGSRYKSIMDAVAEAQAGAFDDASVRVKISRKAQPDIFIDKNGGVQVDGAQSRLTSEGLSSVRTVLEMMRSNAEKDQEAKFEEAMQRAMSMG